MQAHVPRSPPQPRARAHVHAGSPATCSHTRVHDHGWAAAPGAYPWRSPVLARRPLAQLAEVFVQPGAARTAQPQHQRQPQQRAQQQGGGQGAPPCQEPHVSARLCPAPPRAAQSPILFPAAPPTKLVPSPRSSVAAGPLSWLPPAPGLSQVGGAQPGSQWQCPWLLHTWVGDTEPQPPAAGSPRVPCSPTAHPVPVALAPALLVTQH